MFITFEGPEGSGKTSQITLLANTLRQKGYKVFTTREPGGTLIGDQVRSILLSRMENKNMNPRAEILLFCAARAQLVDEVIRPHLAQGEVVLCDRYADSSLAYQGYGHGLDIDFLSRLLDFATGGLKPDLTLLMDIDPEVGLRRRMNSGGEWNRLDAYELAFHKRVRLGYLKMADENSDRWKVIDAGQPPEVVQTSLINVVLSQLKNFTRK
ncbi:MAG: dTMP kinase [Anaerolineae bacterium]|nr:dTMP kinase [Anaerolineae bacterium]